MRRVGRAGLWPLHKPHDHSRTSAALCRGRGFGKRRGERLSGLDAETMRGPHRAVARWGKEERTVRLRAIGIPAGLWPGGERTSDARA